MPEKQIIAKKINDWLNACVDENGAFFLNTIEAGRLNRVLSVSTC